MKVGGNILRAIISVVAFSTYHYAAHAQPFSLAIRPLGGQIQFSWPAALSNSSQSLLFPEYQIQSSTDLVSWSAIGGRLRGIEGRSGPMLNLSVEKALGPVFYRLKANLNPQTENETGMGGAEVFGYNDQFAQEIKALDQLSVEEFATNGSGTAYVPRLTWDPTTAEYWTNFYSTNLQYLTYGAMGGLTSFPYNFHLDSTELSLFMTNGFVVSERLGSPTFGDAYYRLFNADLPVFITADSLLHAWHRSYQSMLEELEELQLSTLLSGVISNMSAQLPRVWQDYGSGPLRDSILDADYYLTVANSLWAGQQVASAQGDSDVNQQVASTLAATGPWISPSLRYVAITTPPIACAATSEQ
jgi:hypothetical protein